MVEEGLEDLKNGKVLSGMKMGFYRGSEFAGEHPAVLGCIRLTLYNMRFVIINVQTDPLTKFSSLETDYTEGLNTLPKVKSLIRLFRLR